MRVVPRENEHQGDQPGPDARSPEQEPGNGHQPLDVMRSWLVSGVQFVDRRRRFGAHVRARELLVVDRPVAAGASQRWHTLAAALHRYTVRSGLWELSPEHRQVITLAYLEGRTNREIAAALGVSITTVRRRLLVALGLLEAYLGRSGAWLSALLLGAAMYSLNHSARFVRWVTTAAGSADKAQRMAATVTAGALATAALAFTADTPTPGKSHRAATPPSIAQTALAAGPNTLIAILRSAPSPAQPKGVAHVRIPAVHDPAALAATASQHNDEDCDGSRTGAPPDVPVGPRAGHPAEPPVAHPEPGGCED